jgi:hypothetical protein
MKDESLEDDRYIRDIGPDWRDGYVDENGVFRWKSCDDIPPEDMIKKLAEYHSDEFDVQATLKAREREVKESLEQYRERMEDHEPSGEEIAEMKSAFGEDETVVNVITGERTDLSKH